MSCAHRQSHRSLFSFLFIFVFPFLSAAAFACPSDKDGQVTDGFATRDANAALNDYALLFQDTTDANVACQQVAHDRFLQKLKNIFGIDDPALLNTQTILTHGDILGRTVLPFQGWLEGADAAMAFVLAYRLNALGLLSSDIAQYLDKVAELLIATGSPTGIPLPSPVQMPAQPLIGLSSLESDSHGIVCGLNETKGWADECMDDYSVASAGFAWAAAYQKLRGINPQAAIDRANLLISETFSGRASVCLVFKDTIDPTKNPPSTPQYGGANQRGPCQATPADVKAGTALVLALNHGPENPAYGIGLMTSTSTAILALNLAGASHNFSDYEQIVANGLLDEEQRTTSGSQFLDIGCYGFNTTDQVTFTYDNLQSCSLPENPPYFPDMFPVHKFYESFMGLDIMAPFPMAFNDGRFPKDDFNQVNGRFGAGREFYYGSFGWDNRTQLLPLLLPGSTPPPFPQLQGMHATSSCDRIDGFAEDMMQTNNPVDVSIYRYVFSRHTRSFIYELIATLSANVGADLVPATSGRGYHGFLEYLPNLLKDGTITPIRVQFTTNNQLLSNTDQSLDTSACAVNPPPGPYEGWFDFANCDQTGGWVWDPNFPTTPVDIEVLVDGSRMAILSANLFGSDLLQAGKGDGKHRFTWYIPTALKGNGSHTISFRTFGANSLVLPIVSPSTTSGSISCAAPPPPPPPPAQVSLNTPAGSYITVSAPAASGQVPYAEVTFDSVQSPGNTIFTPVDPSSAGTMPNGYVWPTAPIQPVMMQISTSAVFSGNVTVRIHATAEQDSTEFDQLRIIHLEHSQYVDLTTLAPALGAPDFPSRVFQAPVVAFSPFNPFMIVRELVPVTLTGASQVASITYGQSVGITAQLASSISTPAATGTLTLMDGGAAVQTAAVQGAGSYPFTAAGLSAGTHAFTIAYSGDAEFLQGSSAQFSVSVSPAPLSISVNNASRFYGDVNPVFTGTITDLLNGDNISASYQSSATAASVVGTYAITATLSDPGGRLGNYSITQGSGTLTVQAAPLQATANNKTKMYGDPVPVLDGTLTGIRNADNIAAQYSTTATAQSLVGTYPITITLSDPNHKLGNYAATLTNGAVTVTRSNIALAVPTFNPPGGTYPPGTSIAITEPTSGSAAIHYTTNGTTPTASSPLYTGPVVVNTTNFTQIQAMAAQPEYLDSSVGSASYSTVLSVSATPASQTLVNCASVNYSISVFPPSIAVGTLTFSVSGLPPGATASFSPATVNNSGSSTLAVTTSTSTPPGTYTLTISAGNAAISGSKSVTLVVQDFNFSITPSSQTVTAGGGANYLVSGTIMNGFAGTVGLSISGLPVGASGTFSPASYTGAGASTLSISTLASTPVGTYSLTVAGTNACRVHTISITLVVNAPPPTGPSISSLSVSAGPVGTAVTITGVNFGAAQGSSTVTFNGTVAPPTAWSSTSISVAVPRGAKTGNVIVSAGGQVSNGVAFAVQDDAVHIFGTNCATCGWQTTDFTIQATPAYGYTIRSGDILYFYQWQNSSSVAGIEVCFPGGENVFCADGTTVDQDGKPVYADTITAATHFRRLDLSASAGQMLNQISFHSHGSTKAGRWDVYFSNVQIVSADGSVRSIFVTGSIPSFFVSTSYGVTGVGWAIEHNHVW